MTQPSAAVSTATVTVFGGSQVEVKPVEGDTVAGVLQAALKLLGLPQGTADSLGVVKNGEDAELDDPVVAGDMVAAAPNVANG
jgi:hypothetical protein